MRQTAKIPFRNQDLLSGQQPTFGKRVPSSFSLFRSETSLIATVWTPNTNRSSSPWALAKEWKMAKKTRQGVKPHLGRLEKERVFGPSEWRFNYSGQGRA